MFNVLIIRKQWPNSKNEKTEWNADSKGVEVAGGGGGGVYLPTSPSPSFFILIIRFKFSNNYILRISHIL